METVISYLQDWKSRLIQESKNTNQTDLVKQVSRAIQCLERCEKYHVVDVTDVVVLPMTTTLSASSEYRIIEDQESDDPTVWTELSVHSKHVRPVPGTVLFVPRHPELNLRR
jgi:hypothetical protein